ncbi:MAG: RNA 2',3'-cyclic phosphodiesterase [Candidatus Andersenbacteria bacterium]|nr:RNA 2',3'-cyclic phosphodiesterase [Candidatus Andersenbacteria bacterium]MBI3250417.1 RNA 2',3'-cyclic phosphodiesterase [Candidatus Andersenbacteria bacterium]
MTIAPSARALHIRTTAAVPEMSRIFLAIPIPAAASTVLTNATESYLSEVKDIMPNEKWHITMTFLGEVKDFSQYLPEITASLPQEYVSVVSVTHIGRGKKSDQLWAYVYKTPALEHIRVSIEERLISLGISITNQEQQFIPHINLAHLKKAGKVTDTPCSLTFPVHEIGIYQSIPDGQTVQYNRLGDIALTP